MKQLHVLLADDSRDAADSLAEALCIALENVTVDVAYDGEQALRMALTRRPDVVVLDLEMPGFDGQDVAERLRDIHLEPPRLIALSGNVRRLAALPKDSVFERVIYKPADVSALVHVLVTGELPPGNEDTP